MLKHQGLRGGVLYYDGQFDDARMNLAIGLTAAREGAVIANHVAVESLTQQGGRVSGAAVVDRLTGERFEVPARAVVNATGPFTDAVRRMEDADARPMVTASSGIHIVLDQRFSPPATGLLIPQTEDGRVLFLLPWLGHTLVGTTDDEAAIEEEPRVREEEIAYVLRHVERYFDVPVTRADVKAAWSGLRPLVSDPEAADTAGLSRDHIVNVGPAGLVTIAGGKWTTYRRMAVDAVNEAVRVGGLSPSAPSTTATLTLVGGEGFSAQGAGALQERFSLDADVASYLNRAYGSFAPEVAGIARDGHGGRLVDGHPHLEAEVVYAARHEYARSTSDVLWRRLRLGVLDETAAAAALERVSEVLAGELGWDAERRARDLDEARALIGAAAVP
jgi:glycerol-3-phosphate dehydrogenase